HAEIAALVVLAVGGTSDWVDGYLARRLRQVSRLGELLDPLADRLYILATLLALSVRGVTPWWFTGALLLRDLVLLLCLLVLRRYGYEPLPVHYLGKTATFILLFAFPVLLLAHASSGAAGVAWPTGWALALRGRPPRRAGRHRVPDRGRLPADRGRQAGQRPGPGRADRRRARPAGRGRPAAAAGRHAARPGQPGA